MEKAIAVVVSFNRQALLSECIDALRKQTRPLDAILVVNNGSTDNTEEWLKEQKDIFHITQKNIGSGGGFNTAISWAFKHGYTWIWCMDDDGYPAKNAFENLMNAPLDRLHLRNCAVIDKEDKKTFVWKTGNCSTIDEVNTRLINGIGHPFNGTLLNRFIIERVGLPKKELFLWGDEAEYYHRIISKNRIPVSTITDSIHYHPASAYSYKNDWDFNSNWKMYFYVRNRFHTHKTRYSTKLSAFLHYSFFVMAFLGIIAVYQKTDKFKKMNFVLWPAKHALSNNFEETPGTILNKLNRESSPVLLNYWISLRAAAMNFMFSLLYTRPGTAKAS
ncbi:MAG: glycosyltransferase family 2 protein [Ferruginibacter sp.]